MNRQGGTVEVFPTHDALLRAAAEAFTALAAAAIGAGGRFVVALSGGSTPRGLYERLATAEYAPRVDWSRVHVAWGDERAVPPGDGASNYRLAQEALLARVPVPAANVHRIHGEDEPAAAAAAYERTLRRLFATASGPPRTTAGARFDLVLLGLGADGHTASLFPGSAALAETTRWVAAENHGKGSRVTLTRSVIQAAAEILFLVSGPAKAAVLARVLDGPHQPEMLPAQAIAPSAGRLRWLVDAEAARGLAGQTGAR